MLDFNSEKPEEQTPSSDSFHDGRLVRVEANLLRFPLFALSTKNLTKMTGIRCTGEYERDGNNYSFEIKTARNADTAYPGPMSRAVHFALLDILTEGRYPICNPIKWSWVDLCRRLKIKNSGRAIVRMKEAIRATTGLVIWSNQALYSKARGQILSTTEEGQSLYQQYIFASGKQGGKKNRNQLWLADWYLDNLNAFYSCPLNFDLWLALDNASPIASRLYELLFYRFCRKVDSLQFNYSTLSRLLPVNEEPYRSLAEKQLNPAMNHLVSAGVVLRFEWTESKEDIGKIVFHRGKLLDLPGEVTSSNESEGIVLEKLRVETLTGRGTDEEDIVADFYRLWLNQSGKRVTREELTYARQLLEEHGKTKARALIPIVVEVLKKKWPEAKTFSAVKNYLKDALAQFNQAEKRRAVLEEQRRRDRDEREQKRCEAIERERWLAEWHALSTAEQESIRQVVIARNPGVESMKSFFQMMCLAELKARQSS